MELWQPAGVVGVISAFNFPVAVWGWNAALAWVCGDAVVWKPARQGTLCALACEALFARAAAGMDDVPRGLLELVPGEADAARALAQDVRVPVLSATGSTRMGRAVAPLVASRFGRAILELGGNNGAIVCPSADLDLVLPAVVFAAVGTAGQRCTSLRRLFVHQRIYPELLSRLRSAWVRLQVGNPLDAGTLVGPLVSREAFETMQLALARLRTKGGRTLGGERVDVPGCEHGWYVRPALAEVDAQGEGMCAETFAPILHVMPHATLEEAIALHNAVPQGLASAIFTRDVAEAEQFLSARGSDCGIANVNTGPSGAEIGVAFGGEKDTGGGREAGSDAWKSYMRRMSCTLNHSGALPLAQGIHFDLR
jgi:aldehyde dehydrogenase (NAD+)